MNEVQHDWRQSDAGLLRVGYVVVGILVLVGGFWAGFAPIESAAIAPGTLQVEGKRKAVQHLEGGIVSEILIKNGDRVAIGQPMILLDATKDRSQLNILRGRLFNMEALVSRLVAERDGSEAVVWRRRLREYESDARSAEAVANEAALFEARLNDRHGEKALIQQTIDQQTKQLNGLKALAESKLNIIDSLDIEIRDLAELLADGYVNKQRLRELERMRAQHAGDQAELVAKIAAIEIAIQESKLRIIQLEMRFKNDVVAQLSEQQAKLFDVEQQYLAAEERVQRATIRAPVDGIVLGLKKNTVGAVISPAEQLLEIVPQVDSLVVAAMVAPIDIDRIHVGQPAEVRFSVFKDAYSIGGSLRKVSADTLLDERTGLDYYSVEIDLLQEDLSLLEGFSLLPGMPVEVLIKTGNRTMYGYLSSSFSRGFARSLTEE